MNRRLYILIAALLLLFGICDTAYADGNIVQPSGDYVSDYADIISGSIEKKMNGASDALEQHAKGAQLIVVTVPTLGGLDLETYANRLIREWGVGSSQLNNGVVILVSMEPRNIRIEVGKGLEGALNDAKCGRILDNYAIPFMKDNDYDQGIYGAYAVLFNEICKEYELDPVEVSAGIIEEEKGESRNNLLSIIALVIMVFVIVFFFRRNRRGGGGTGGGRRNNLWPLIMYEMGRQSRRSGYHGRHRGGGFGGSGGSRGGGGGFRGGGGSGGGGGASRGF